MLSDILIRCSERADAGQIQFSPGILPFSSCKKCILRAPCPATLSSQSPPAVMEIYCAFPSLPLSLTPKFDGMGFFSTKLACKGPRLTKKTLFLQCRMIQTQKDLSFHTCFKLQAPYWYHLLVLGAPASSLPSQVRQTTSTGWVTSLHQWLSEMFIPGETIMLMPQSISIFDISYLHWHLVKEQNCCTLCLLLVFPLTSTSLPVWCSAFFPAEAWFFNAIWSLEEAQRMDNDFLSRFGTYDQSRTEIKLAVRHHLLPTFPLKYRTRDISMNSYSV